MNNSLHWESAGTEEPRDQNADSSLVPAGATSAYYSLGPADAGRWSLEYIAVRHGEEVPELGRSFGQWTSEEKAKAAAQNHEDAAR